ncbi:MAG: hypothetical protein OYH77_05620 [Pseudomonadota bacterium]|nr:hypothetical protein [Pseudomonadota bacterium]
MNIHDIISSKAWTEPSSIDMLLYGMSKVWNADDLAIKRLFDKAHALERDEGGYLTLLHNYTSR